MEQGGQRDVPLSECLAVFEKPENKGTGVEVRLEGNVVKWVERGKGEKIPLIRQLPIREVLNDVQEAERRWEEKAAQAQADQEKRHEAPAGPLQRVGNFFKGAWQELTNPNVPTTRKLLWRIGLGLTTLGFPLGLAPLGLTLLGGAGVLRLVQGAPAPVKKLEHGEH